MNNCSNCNAELADGDLFCGECGEKVKPPVRKPKTEPLEIVKEQVSSRTGSKLSTISTIIVIIVSLLLTGAIAYYIKENNGKFGSRTVKSTATTSGRPAVANRKLLPKAPSKAPPKLSDNRTPSTLGVIRFAAKNAEICDFDANCKPAEGAYIRPGNLLASNKDWTFFSIDDRG